MTHFLLTFCHIRNLGRNSLKFVTKGFVRLRAEVDDETGMVIISVEDSGIGKEFP
jgi:signal transduction histidine kinase